MVESCFRCGKDTGHNPGDIHTSRIAETPLGETFMVYDESFCRDCWALLLREAKRIAPADRTTRGRHHR